MNRGAALQLALASLALAGLSCAERELRFLPTGAARAMILVGQRGGSLDMTIEARDVSEAGNVERVLELDEDVRLVALLYDRTLAELELEPGTLTIAAVGRKLPAPASTWALDVTAGDAGQWRALGAVPPDISEVRIHATPCVRFQAERLPLAAGLGSTPRLLVPIDGRRLLLATAPDSRFFVLTATSAAEISLPPSTPHAAGFLDGDGQLWLASLDGRVVRGDLARGFQPMPPIEEPIGGALGIDGARGGAPREAYAITSSAAVLRFSGDAWTRVRAPSVRGRRSRIGVAWSAPGEAYAIGADHDVILEIWGDAVTERVLPVPEQPTSSADAFFEIAWVDGIGVIAGTRYNRLFVRRDTSWDLLPLPPSNARAHVLVSLGGGGVLFGGQGGVLTQHFEGYGYCAPEASHSEGRDVDLALPVEEGVILVYSAPGPEPAALMLRRLDL